MRGSIRGRVGLLLACVLVSSLTTTIASAEHPVVVCRIDAVALNGRCRTELVAIEHGAGAWLSWLMGPRVIGYVGSYAWRLSWGDAPERSWISLTCPAGPGTCLFAASPVRERLELGDEMLFEGTANAILGQAGTMIYGVALRE